LPPVIPLCDMGFVLNSVLEFRMMGAWRVYAEILAFTGSSVAGATVKTDNEAASRIAQTMVVENNGCLFLIQPDLKARPILESHLRVNI